MTRRLYSILLMLPLLVTMGACASIQSQWQLSAARSILNDTTKYDRDVQLLYQTLETAYAIQSPALLDRFCEVWQRDPDLQPLLNTIALSDTVKAVYDVFRAFADTLYHATLPFVVLPTSVTYSVDDSIGPAAYYSANEYFHPNRFRISSTPLLTNRKMPSHSIDKFRPSYRIGNSRILYLSQAYDRALHLFLKPPEVESAESFKPFALEARKRSEFLRHRIPVMRGHNGYYFFFEEPPMFNRLYLSKDLNYAEVSHSRGDFSGSTDAFIKANHRWILFHPFFDLWIQ